MSLSAKSPETQRELRVSDTSPFDRDRNLPSKADALTQELRAALEPSEKLLWSGFPAQGIRFSP
jgi:hypothetical protein